MSTFIKTPFAVEGDIEAIPDAMQTDGKVSMQTGYTFDYERDLETDPSAKDIGRPEMNWLFNLVTDAIRQYQTEGTFPFVTAAINGGTAFPYKKFARCTYTGGSVSGIFESLADNNTSDPTDTTRWKKLVTPGEISVNTTAPLTGGGELSGNLTLGLASPLPVANGGTGLTAAPSMLTNLAATTAASPLVASPRPGVTGTLPIANGGTGNTTGLAVSATALATARTIQTNLASTVTASFDGSANVTAGVTGTLPIANGGTGSTAAAAGRANLGAAPLPTASAVVGQWTRVAVAAGVAISLPSGGTWAYIYFTRDNSVYAQGQALLHEVNCGVAAGGTLVAAAIAGYQQRIICWRIA